MKKITSLFMALALCGGAFVYTGCTDFTEDINAVNARVDKLDTSTSSEIKSAKDQIAALQSAVSDLQKAKAEAETAVGSLLTNLTNLQKTVDALNSAKTVLEGKVAALEADNTTNKAQIDQNKKDIAAAKTAIATLENKVANLETDMAAAKGQIADLTNRIALAEGNITAMQAVIAKKADQSTLEAVEKALQAKIDEKANSADVAEALTKQKNELLDAIKVKLDEADFEAYKTANDAVVADLKEKVAANAADIAKKADQTALVEAVGRIIVLETTAVSLQNQIDKCATEDWVKLEEIALTEAYNKAIKVSADELTEMIGTKVDTAVYNAAVKKIYEDLASQADFTALKNAYDALVLGSTKNIAAIEADITSLEGALSLVKGDLEDAIELFKGDIATINDTLVELQGKIADNATEIDNLIGRINGSIVPSIREAEQNILDIKDDIATIKKEYATIAQVDEKISALNDILEPRIVNLEEFQNSIETWKNGELKEWIEDVENYKEDLEEYKENLENVVIKGINDEISALKEQKLAVDAYKADTAEIWASIRNLEDELETVKTTYATLDQLESVSNVADYVYKAVFGVSEGIAAMPIVPLAQQMKDVQGRLADAQRKIETIENETVPAVNELVARLSEISNEVFNDLKGKVEDLAKSFVERIQSVVFVPEFTDMAAHATDYVIGTSRDSYNTVTEGLHTDFDEVAKYVWVRTGRHSGHWRRTNEIDDKKLDQDDLAYYNEFGKWPWARRQGQNIASFKEYKVYNCTGWNYVPSETPVDEVNDWSLGYQVVYGTFQVQPARLVSQLKQDYENEKLGVYMQMVDVKEATRVANVPVLSEDLEILSVDPATGYVEVRARFATSKYDGHSNSPRVISLFFTENVVDVTLPVQNSTEEEGEAPQSVPSTPLIMPETVPAAPVIGTFFDPFGKYICSHYVPVRVYEENVAENYVFASIESLEEYPTRQWSREHNDESFENTHDGSREVYGQVVDRAWDMFQDSSLVDFHEGYAPAFKVEGEVKSLADAAASIFLPVEAITPVYHLWYDFTDVYIKKVNVEEPINKAENEEALMSEFNVAGESPVIYINQNEKASEAMPWVNDFVNARSSWTLHNIKVLGAYDTYTIIKRQIKLAADEIVFPWTYEFALKHSDNPADPTKENAVANDTVGIVASIVENVNQQFDGIDFAALIASGDVSYDPKVTRGGVLVPTPSYEFELKNGKANDDAKSFTADVSFKAESYEFDKNDTTLVETAVSFSDEANEVIVNYTFKYGTHPDNLTFDFGRDDFYYTPKVTIDSVGVFALEDAVKKDADYASYFKDNDEFIGSFNLTATTNVPSGKRITDEVENAVSDYTYVSLNKDAEPGTVDNPGEVYVRLSQADVTAYSDKYELSKVYKTWYGVDYTFNVDLGLKAPAFSLRYWPNSVTTTGSYSDDDPKSTPELYPAPYAIIAGRYAAGNVAAPVLNGTQGKYIINEDNLSNYYQIHYAEDIPATETEPAYWNGGKSLVSDAEKPYLSVVYEIVPTDEPADYFQNVPSIVPVNPKTTYNVSGDQYNIDACPIVLGDYTARKLATKATLYCYGVKVNELPLNLYINEPVKFLPVENAIITKRICYQPATANLFEYLKIYGILNPTTNLVGATGYLFENPYGLNLVFGENDIKTYTGTYDDSANHGRNTWIRQNMVGTSLLSYDAANGKVTYNGDSKMMQSDVIVEVNVSLYHNFDFNHYEKYESHVNNQVVTIVFRQAADEPGEEFAPAL